MRCTCNRPESFSNGFNASAPFKFTAVSGLSVVLIILPHVNNFIVIKHSCSLFLKGRKFSEVIRKKHNLKVYANYVPYNLRLVTGLFFS